MILSIALLGMSLHGGMAQVQGPSDITSVLQKAIEQQRNYVRSFKDLTAVETKTTELFDKQGEVEKQRYVVSDFLVYESQLKRGVVYEYRITREVDGKLIGVDDKQAVQLFEKLAKAKTLEQEGDRLRKENLNHTLRYYRWGVTLQPALQLEFQGYTYELAGRETVGNREAIVLNYRRNDFRSGEFQGLVKGFKNPRTGNRGRVWLDAKTLMFLRWENESTIVDRDISNEAVLSRDEIEYQPSMFGFNVPKRIVTSFFEKAKTDNRFELRLAGRITYTYQAFNRFNVETDYRIESR